MIKVEKLTKSYKIGKRKITPISNVSFTLGETGFVFITGKSGSGKSTLLNMISGLDNLTSGDVIIGDKQFSKFTPQDYVNYRNNYLGFIFQDFHLIKELTVYQNVELALSIKGEKNDALIKSTLEKVGLKDYHDRYSNELSGGQKQRVAIARALVKNPKIILADEPTGNLDSKTSIQILKLLKKISKTNLVVIVSHNLEDAYNYADRIIELSDGKIINDLKREEGYQNNFKIDDGIVTLPYNKELTKVELDTLKIKVMNNEVTDFKQLHNGFKPSGKQPVVKQNVELKKSKFRFKEIIRLSKLFTKSHFVSYVLTTILISSLVVLLGLSQLFINFDSASKISETMEGTLNDTAILEKGVLSTSKIRTLSRSYMNEIGANDISALRNNGYEGNAYVLYNYSIPVSLKSTSIASQNHIATSTNFSKFYIQETYGTLITSEEYLTRLYGKNGQLVVLAGDIHDVTGVIITDYVADAMMFHRPTVFKNYTDVLGPVYNTSTYSYANISAIIDTDYEEKYKPLKDQVIEILGMVSPGNKMKELYASDAFIEYYTEVKGYLGIAYTFNQSFMDNLKDGVEKDIAYLTRTQFVAPNGATYSRNNSAGWRSKAFGITLNENEIVLNISTYNSIFQTKYTTSNYTNFVPHKIKIRFYPKYVGTDTEVKEEIEVTIARIDNTSKYSMIYSDDVFAKVIENETIGYALYLDNIDKIGELHSTFNSLDYYIESDLYTSITTITNIVIIFGELFSLITIFIISACAFLIIYFASYNIKKNKFNIGVLKALGTNTFNVLKIFSLQVLLVGVSSSILSAIGVYVFTGITNDILVNSLVNILYLDNIIGINILEFNPLIVGIDLLFITSLTIITSLLPIITLHRIKPMNIIRSKD
jgi:ABC-type lipoprotein export system ATPase subunit